MKSRAPSLRHPWPLAGSVLAFAAVTAGLLRLGLEHTRGTLVYALDDAYIHMAMAKHLAVNGVFGVTPSSFSFSSSSPLWTLLIALLYGLFGVSEWIPLALNLAAGCFALGAAHWVLAAHGVSSLGAWAVLLGIAFLTPLPPLALSGQEHLLHAALSLGLVHSAAVALAAGPGQGTDCSDRAVLVWSALAVVTRYEALFLVALIALLLLWRGRWRFTAALAALALLPVVALGLFAVSKGWRILPYSILLKAPAWEDPTGLLRLVPFVGGVPVLIQTPHLLVLVLGVGLLAVLPMRRRQGGTAPRIMALLFVGTSLLHVGYARTGWFYRYEAYLMALGLVVLGVLLRGDARGGGVGGSRPRAATLLAAVLALTAGWPVLRRAAQALRETPLASRNIYEQQYQMGLFLAAFYPGQPVAANDVGAINYLAELETLDLWGLSNREVAEARLRGRLSAPLLEELVRRAGTKVAILYPDWFNATGGVPRSWVPVGRWQIRDNVVCGSDTVTFYAVDRAESAALLRNLRAFGPRLPPRVIQMGPYLEGPPG